MVFRCLTEILINEGEGHEGTCFTSSGLPVGFTATAAKLNMLINQSPWFDGFRETLVMYEEETGETIELDVTPYPVCLKK